MMIVKQYEELYIANLNNIYKIKKNISNIISNS